MGLGPEPFGSVLGDPLTGSPLADVSMDDSVYDEEQQAGPKGVPGGAPSLDRPAHGVPGKYR
ncbi:hypothetical protein D5R93_00405 [Actinomyces lilanjuaniae]|uniref:Uncharacterized protein n=1 Tax=Actinomyces lilanjuaniae TaxID=2321394 RepID=A0ABN5PL69_9ACTO|nr:hypothetical protein [Actinomyces lilanjuaniae]AYD88901.1 hypothetical protein D5R93_00405 [Actinomyces lilanjuaniae]